MRIVLDTNVLISGVLTPFGTCGDVLRLSLSGGIVICVDARILLEYQSVLSRPRFCLDAHEVEEMLAQIGTVAEIHVPPPISIPLPDPDDRPFLEVALAANADALVTGNLRHFPKKMRCSVRVLTPAEFIESLHGGSATD